MNGHHRVADHACTELRRGIITIIVLAMLRTSRHAYSLIKDISQFGLSLEEGTLYPLLHRLERSGMVTARWDDSGNRARKYYLLSGDGEILLREMSKQYSSLDRILCSVNEVCDR